jgi:hypothetical protein
VGDDLGAETIGRYGERPGALTSRDGATCTGAGAAATRAGGLTGAQPV